MSLIRMEPFGDLTHVHEHLTRLFDDALGSAGRRPRRLPAAATWRPPVNIFETSDSIMLELETAGFDREDIKLEVDGGTLTIRGERKEAPGEDGGRWLKVERYHGDFERSFVLPPTVDPEGIRANLRNGLLEVTLPKRPEATKRSISIKS